MLHLKNAMNIFLQEWLHKLDFLPLSKTCVYLKNTYVHKYMTENNVCQSNKVRCTQMPD